MSSVRRTLLALLPKVLLSRLTGLATRIRLPGPVRGPSYRWFARRYGVELAEIAGELREYPSFAHFFSRPLRPGARPTAEAPLVAPCDGRIVTAGPLDGDRIPQVKGVDYGLGELVGDADLTRALAGGSQATIYLAPGAYHRVHAPFDGELRAIRALPGTLYPVNEPAVRAIDGLFVKNARVVFSFVLADGRAAAVVMVGALNVGDIRKSVATGASVGRGDEIGRFGFGSTTVTLVAQGTPALAARSPGDRVRAGESLSA